MNTNSNTTPRLQLAERQQMKIDERSLDQLLPPDDLGANGLVLCLWTRLVAAVGQHQGGKRTSGSTGHRSPHSVESVAEGHTRWWSGKRGNLID